MNPRPQPVASGEDWHLHTHLSDGFAHPHALVTRAGELGLRRIAITDHDCLDAVRDARVRARATQLEIELITGIEIDCRLEGQGIEILGYAFDPENEPLRARLRQIQADRRARLRFFAERLACEGAPVEIEQLLGGPARAYLKVHLYRALAAGGRTYAGGYPEFSADLRRFGDAPAVRTPSLDEAVTLVRGAGGFALLAHPLYYRERIGLDRLVAAGRAAGCLGAEFSYPYDFGPRGWAPERVRDGLRELRTAIRASFPDGAWLTRGTDCHDLAEWEPRLAWLSRWERELGAAPGPAAL